MCVRDKSTLVAGFEPVDVVSLRMVKVMNTTGVPEMLVICQPSITMLSFPGVMPV